MKGSASFSIQPSHDTRFSAFPVGALGVSNKDFIALLFLGEGLGEERPQSRLPVHPSSFSVRSSRTHPAWLALKSTVNLPGPNPESLLASSGGRDLAWYCQKTRKEHGLMAALTWWRLEGVLSLLWSFSACIKTFCGGGQRSNGF